MSLENRRQSLLSELKDLAHDLGVTANQLNYDVDWRDRCVTIAHIRTAMSRIDEINANLSIIECQPKPVLFNAEADDSGPTPDEEYHRAIRR